MTEIRQKITPVFDLRELFDLPSQNQASDLATIIVKFGEDRVGYLVDAVTDIEKVDQDSFLNAESCNSLAKTEFVQSVFSVNEDVTIVVDIDRVLSAHGNDHSNILTAA